MTISNVTIRQMLESGVHFGHQVSFWNPKMAPYIFGSRNKIHIIDLEKTLPLYEQARNFLGSVAAKKGKVLFVGTKQQARDLIREEARRCGMPYVNHRWLGGMLTNYKTIRQSLKRLRSLEELSSSQTFARIPKKESLFIGREIVKLEQSLGGIRSMGGLPDAIFVIDVDHEKIAISEARKLKIPIVGVVDSNSSPDGIDYVIPGNDDSIRAIKFYLSGIADAIVDARNNTFEEEGIEEKLAGDEKRGLKKVALAKGKISTEKRSESNKPKIDLISKVINKSESIENIGDFDKGLGDDELPDEYDTSSKQLDRIKATKVKIKKLPSGSVDEVRSK